jgi:nucleoside-diphosphate-sugar epimerase
LPAEFVCCELSNSAGVTDLLRDADAIVYLGAIPGPQRAAPRSIFENNVAGDFNVMMSAAELGRRRVVFYPAPSAWAGHTTATLSLRCTFPWMKRIP